ncbi:MAG: sulfoxide reductase heme-binding subunit YedZ [Gammaproteobacteria bacterium]|nr:sulfoxide reductase heme-binding subunit YedZ [Gammaproteobacteria bacterium]
MNAATDNITAQNFFTKLLQLKFLKPLVFILCLLPMALLVQGAINGTLGVNPVETLIREMGDWAIYFLLMTLSITPLRALLNLSWLIKCRRMLGLFSFFYACLHFVSFIWFEHFFDLTEIVKDIIKRPFITIGFVCLLMLSALAVTSTDNMIRRLKKRWKTLHQLVYPIALLALLHYFMMIKADYQHPLILLVWLVALFGYRYYVFLKKVKKTTHD